MPKVKSEKIELIEAGGPQEHTVTYTVNNDGLFFAQVPDELGPVLRALLRGDDDANGHEVLRRERAWGDIEINRPWVHLRVEGTQLRGIEDLIAKAVAGYNKPEVTKELVIIYAYSGEASVWRTPTGEFVPNGASAREAAKRDGIDSPTERYGNWVETGGVNATHPAHGGYSVRFGARGCMKITTRRGPHVTHKYRWHGPEMDLDKEHPLSRLNEFFSFSMPDPGSFEGRKLNFRRYERKVSSLPRFTPKHLPCCFFRIFPPEDLLSIHLARCTRSGIIGHRLGK
ncbi:hypothetical protein [Marinobacter salsuginis]|uniref:Uncharacterized protein n=1 Tax=Marinobacter salsuginis TaxID=418719 RepID=A0A5M3Q3D4_9GAMM|nr:hypothetical protein [Marinobacter salsuginis]GBO89170.1 hypothetical protein MSSD14B_28380 [Marinobacter salsuginis]